MQRRGDQAELKLHRVYAIHLSGSIFGLTSSQWSQPNQTNPQGAPTQPLPRAGMAIASACTEGSKSTPESTHFTTLKQ